MNKPFRFPRTGDTYRHFKGGNYRVLGAGVDSETEGAVVLYQRLAPSFLSYPHDKALIGSVWVRSIESWCKPVDRRSTVRKIVDFIMRRAHQKEERFSFLIDPRGTTTVFDSKVSP